MATQGQALEGTAQTNGAGPQIDDVMRELGGLAQLANAAGGAAGCLIAFRSPSGAASVWAADWGVVQLHDDGRVLELVARWSAGYGGQPLVMHRLSPSETAILRSLRIDVAESASLVVACKGEGPHTISVAMVSAAFGGAASSTADLAARCTSILLRDWRHAGQALFWRGQAGLLRDALQTERVQAAKAARERARDLAAKRRLAAQAWRGSLAAVASSLSRLGPFEGWFLATREADGVRIRAIHGLPREALAEPGNAAVEALRRRVMVCRRLGVGAMLSAQEGRFQKLGYRAYLSVPLQDGALGLLSRTAVTPETRQRVAAAVKSIQPQLKVLSLSRELERQRSLVRSLVRGLFNTADTERANLRRDLHDDFAQLLAAAQIALDGRPDDARRFFRELEVELRKRLDALRPAPARRAGLKASIAAEVRRLRSAGIEVTLRVGGVRRMPAAAREVFCRVIGEGVSNVIRHAAAKQVDIELQCRDGAASMAITDNGRGSRDGAATIGTGLRGLAQRVEVLGGTCAIDSSPSGTRLCARIPVADL